jgi:hypothetical protein
LDLKLGIILWFTTRLEGDRQGYFRIIADIGIKSARMLSKWGIITAEGKIQVRGISEGA